MRRKPDPLTIDAGAALLELRPDVQVVPQRSGDQKFWHLTLSGARNQHFRLGHAEYIFTSLLNGRTTFTAALAATAKLLGPDALSLTKASELAEWLKSNRIVVERHQGESVCAVGSDSGTAVRASDSWWSRIPNPFWLKVPLGNPTRLLQLLLPATGPLFSGPAVLLGVILIIVACLRLGFSDHDFFSPSTAFFDRNQWLRLGAAWLLLKLIHELAHGTACVRFGGKVPKAGLAFVLLAPLAWVDVSSAWNFRDRWKRIAVAAAGIFAELVISAVCVLIWFRTESVEARSFLRGVVALSGITTVLFNANPLMRFDGYFILMDLLRIPNLADESSRVLKSAAGRIFLGNSVATRSGTGGQHCLLLTYGMSAACWKIIVCVSLALAASVLFEGAGIVIAAAGIIAWTTPILTRSIAALRQSIQFRPAAALRAAAAVGLLVSFAASLCWLVPAPASVSAAGVVTLSDDSVVRAPGDGFISDVHYTNGEFVDSGTPLLTLRNDELTAELRDTECRVRQAELRRLVALEQSDPHAESVAVDQLSALRQQAAALKERADRLTVRAPFAGRVTSGHPEQQVGRYVRAGDELLAVDSGEAPQIRLFVSHDEYSAAVRSLGQAAEARVGTDLEITGVITSVDPRATRVLLHPVLAATNGGPLPVVSAAAEDREAGGIRLDVDYFQVRMAASEMTSDHAAELHRRIGSTVSVFLQRPDRALGPWLTERARDWIRQRLRIESEQSSRS